MVNKICVNVARVLHESALPMFKPISTNVSIHSWEKGWMKSRAVCMVDPPQFGSEPDLPHISDGVSQAFIRTSIAAGINALIRTEDELAPLYLTGNTAFLTASCK